MELQVRLTAHKLPIFDAEDRAGLNSDSPKVRFQPEQSIILVSVKALGGTGQLCFPFCVKQNQVLGSDSFTGLSPTWMSRGLLKSRGT